ARWRGAVSGSVPDCGHVGEDRVMSQTESAPALAEGVDTPTPPVRSTTLLSRSLRVWRTRIGAVRVLILVAIAILGPLVAPYGPEDFIAKPFSSGAASG